MITYHIIATGWNCASFVNKCYESIIDLVGSNWKAYLISDGSTDSTGVKLEKLPKHKNVTVKSYKSNMGAAFRRHQVIYEANIPDEDVIILLGLDDELMPNALVYINQQYLDGKWMT